MGRARGANAILRAMFEDTYGTPPGDDWYQVPFVSNGLGEEQGLIESDLLGQGRDPFDPTYDAANDTGDLTVPVDARNFGLWLKLYFGAPVTTAADAATGSWTFSAQPAAGSTITVNGVAFTFRAGGAAGNEVNIGANLGATMTAVAAALNGSAEADVALATYAATATGVTVTYDAAGLAGNAFTLAASATSTAKPSGATLAGGTNAHVFSSGAQALPSMALEVVHPELAKPHHVHFGAMGNTLRIAMQRRGLLNAVLGMVAQGEVPASADSVAGDPEVMATDRFAQAVGAITLDGDALGNVVSSEFSFSNNLDIVETIRPDSRIDGADPATAMAGGNLVMRFADHALLDAATAGAPVSVSRGWTKGAHSLLIETPRLFLPRFKRTIEGPAGIQVTANPIASKPSDAPMVTITLTNDVEEY